jgi:endonuclease/exonuclease/phosphatase family metal-dependent hydrolase
LGRDRLEAWRANVGAPVALDLAPRSNRAHGEIVFISWNLWIGRGRLAAVVERVRESTDAPLVILAQEAYRADDTVPSGRGRGAIRRTAGGFARRAHPREDIVEAARALALNLRYVPSMRNASAASDRGNAILSDLPLRGARGVELPFVLQRRVALSARLPLARGSLVVVSAHLDPRGARGAAWLGTAGRARQTAHLLEHVTEDVVVLGADLNLGRGRRERSWRLLHEAAFGAGVPAGHPHWGHTFHGIPRLRLDYQLVRDRLGRVDQATVERLDEHPRDRGPTVFGSDHHPLVARVNLT